MIDCDLKILLDRNKIGKEELDRVTYECLILSVFVQLCNYLNEGNNKKELKSQILAGTFEGERHVYSYFIRNHTCISLSINELEYLSNLLKAFLNKSNKRVRIEKDKAISILKSQGNKCNYCKKPLTQGSNDVHVDHIIPFAYVGDELGLSNLQILCESCNKSKSESVIFLFKIFVEKGLCIDSER